MQIKLFNESLTIRFNTLERNIKSKTNSFYDSYLDLLEATIKYMMDENNIQYDPIRICGHIVRTGEAKVFFKETLGLDELLALIFIVIKSNHIAENIDNGSLFNLFSVAKTKALDK